MPDIFHDLPVSAPVAAVFDAVSTPQGLDAWWTLESAGHPAIGERYRLYFGPGYDWGGIVTKSEPSRSFALEIVDSVPDWEATRVGFDFEERDGLTHVRFHHVGWPEENDHYRSSCFCWAMYLRLMKRWAERGERVPYAERLDA